MDEPTQDRSDEIEETELDEQDGEVIPEREEMAVLDIEGGGLGPPQLA